MNRRTDHNQQSIIDALRSIGCTVQDLSQLRRGTLDILVGHKVRNYLIEVKNCTDRAPRLTEREEKRIRDWKGQVGVVTSIMDALAIVLEAEYE
jgi:hypothetical protein